MSILFLSIQRINPKRHIDTDKQIKAPTDWIVADNKEQITIKQIEAILLIGI